MAATKASAFALCSSCRASISSSLPFLRTYTTSSRRSISPWSKSRSSQRQRAYATTSDASAKPPPWPKSPAPTPYEIFGIDRGSPYNKRRFHELVKLYHPDTQPSRGSPAASLPPTTRTDRYRLVVAANDLLSDPTKRRLYDHHGVGWDHGRGPGFEDMRTRDREWRHRPGSAARNATWEDWQRWHEEQRGHGGRPEPLFMSNGMFALLVVSMCMIGAMAQKNRAQSAGEQYVDWAERRNADIGQTMMQTTRASAGMSREERVESFLRERENTGYRYVPNKYDAGARDEGP
ncbi:J domain-containing protein 1 [Lecanicillium sp. MT-2017a]|nr:J domain-containing protein 1 [Lecanicillium sp. MT-2017a]